MLFRRRWRWWNVLFRKLLLLLFNILWTLHEFKYKMRDKSYGYYHAFFCRFCYFLCTFFFFLFYDVLLTFKRALMNVCKLLASRCYWFILFYDAFFNSTCTVLWINVYECAQGGKSAKTIISHFATQKKALDCNRPLLILL